MDAVRTWTGSGGTRPGVGVRCVLSWRAMVLVLGMHVYGIE